MRVLHVVESTGAGVMTSLAGMVEATPEVDHHLALWPRRSHQATPTSLAALPTTELPRAPRAAARALGRLATSSRAHVVHAHSTYAGSLARLAPTGSTAAGAGVVYTPHCFAFERGDLSPAVRGTVRAAERALVRRTRLVAAVCEHEARLATGLGHDDVVVVPNRARPVRPEHRAAPPVGGEALRVVTVGRIGAQKDWRLLLAVHSRVRTLGASVRFTWIGAGDAEAEQQLRAGGVEVTGWLTPDVVHERLRGAHAYLHTAAWEAAPMSLLEAAAVGLPLAVRDLPALAGTPGLADDADALAERVAALRAAPAWLTASRASLGHAEQHSVAAQREAALAAWSRASSAPFAQAPR